MSLGVLHSNQHYHVWTRTISGAEFGNALYENNIDASLAFIGLAQDITKYSVDHGVLKIEDVVNSLVTGRGIYAGTPGLMVVLSECSGGCTSGSWN